MGSLIAWKGEWQGKAYGDKGVILTMEPGCVLQYSHYSPISGLPDAPACYHVVTVELSGEGTRTIVSLSQNNNPTEKAREHSKKNWEMMLAGLKSIVEK